MAWERAYNEGESGGHGSQAHGAPRELERPQAEEHVLVLPGDSQERKEPQEALGAAATGGACAWEGQLQRGDGLHGGRHVPGLHYGADSVGPKGQAQKEQSRESGRLQELPLPFEHRGRHAKKRVQGVAGRRVLRGLQKLPLRSWHRERGKC